MPGPAPKPSHLKAVAGNPGHRPLNKREPAPEIIAPPRPAHLAHEAAAEWDRIVPILIGLKLLSEVDGAALALYCQSYARWQQAEAKIAELRAKGGDGLLIKAPSGYPIQNPYLAVANRAMEDCHKYLQAFGLSPASRSRVSVAQHQGDLFGQDEKTSRYFVA